jgi:hypothetical protein
VRPYLQNNQGKRRRSYGSSSRAPDLQAQRPQFKPQYCQRIDSDCVGSLENQMFKKKNQEMISIFPIIKHSIKKDLWATDHLLGTAVLIQQLLQALNGFD